MCLDFHEGQHKTISISCKENVELKLHCEASVPPSLLKKDAILPKDHRPAGWVGRHTSDKPPRSYHKKYMTGEYTLLVPVEETAGKTVMPRLAETVAMVPLVGGMIGGITDQVGMASGYLYGRLWNSWT